MNLNPIKTYRQRKEIKIKEAINQITQDQNFKFLLEQYNESLKTITYTGKDKNGNAVFDYTIQQKVLKTSIQDYYKKQYKILFKKYGEIKFEKETVTCDWLINVKTDRVH